MAENSIFGNFRQSDDVPFMEQNNGRNKESTVSQVTRGCELRAAMMIRTGVPPTIALPGFHR